ncbi:MAG TPA: biotin/lipoyl-containing protein [Herpetosiphonaceae bacterium]
MIPLVIPQKDVNSDTALLVRWLVGDGASVQKHQAICEVETSKVVFSIESPEDGWLVCGGEEGSEVPFNVPIGFIVASESMIVEARKHFNASEHNGNGQASIAALTAFAGKITDKARHLIETHHIPLSLLPQKAIITERDVLPLIDTKDEFFSPLDQHSYPLDHKAVHVQRVLVLGAGLGAMQVVDILSHDPRVQVIGYLDDNEALHGHTIYGLPVLGPSRLAEDWFLNGRCDAAIIAVSTSNRVRRRWYEWLKSFGMPLVNAIDPSARLNRGVMLGEGNVICAFVHVGVETRIGNNNFISAYNSIDHHNLWASHITTGPQVATSGCVQVGSDVKMGTGIVIQPHITVGQGALIASGAVLTQSIPAQHAAKTRVNIEVTPLRESIVSQR